MVESWPPTVGHFSGSIKCDSKVPFYHLTPNFAIVDLHKNVYELLQNPHEPSG